VKIIPIGFCVGFVLLVACGGSSSSDGHRRRIRELDRWHGWQQRNGRIRWQRRNGRG
jgi:hypothetical protein